MRVYASKNTKHSTTNDSTINIRSSGETSETLPETEALLPSREQSYVDDSYQVELPYAKCEEKVKNSPTFIS